MAAPPGRTLAFAPFVELADSTARLGSPAALGTPGALGAPAARPGAERGSPDGSVTPDGLVAGTYLHGLFESPVSRQRLIAALAHARGFVWSPAPDSPEDPYDRLASLIAAHLDLSRIPALAAALALSPRPPRR
jgi:adenosylcobyric acid synthase